MDLTGTSLLEFLPVYLNTKEGDGISSRTIKNYRNLLSSFFEWLGDREFTQTNILIFRSERLKEASAASVGQDIGAIKAFCSWMVEFKYMDENVCEKVKRPRPNKNNTEKSGKLYLPKPIDIERVIIEGTRDSFSHSQHNFAKAEGRRALEFLFRLPLRISELLAIKIDDLFLDDEFPSFNTWRKAKIHDEVLALPLDMVNELQILKKSRKGHEPVFQINQDRIREYLKRGCKAVGIPYFSPHKFRHIVGTHMVLNGASIEEVAFVLGHDVDVFKKVYMKYVPNYSSDTINRYSPGVKLDRIGKEFTVERLDKSLKFLNRDSRFQISNTPISRTITWS